MGPQTTPEQRTKLCSLINEFRHCVAMKVDELGCTDILKMKIEVPGSQPVNQPPYRASYSERETMLKITNELKQNGLIRDSMSEYSSPVLLVKKKNGESRMVIDYRRLNAQTIKDKFPLPVIDSILDQLGGFAMFCSLDAAHGFFQIPMDEDSIHKAAFTTPDGHYEPLRLFFGLTNGPPVYQRMMTKAMGELLWKIVMCFVDDLIIGATDFDDMLIRLRKVFEKLNEAHLTLRLSKCEFAMQEIEFLGFKVSNNGVQPGPRKLAAITEFPIPKNVHDIRRFLGLTSFFRRFIERYAQIASPLSQLLKKTIQFSWTVDTQQAFEQLKERLVKEPILRIFNPQDETEVHTDASSVGLAGMLLQKDRDNKWRLVYCISRKTSEVESKYHSSKLELMAIAWALTRLRPYLIGIKFTLVTDCSALVYLDTQKSVKPQVARWFELLQEYDFIVKYRPGEKMAHVDALSRAPTDERDVTPAEEYEPVGPMELNEKLLLYITTEEDKIALIQSQDKELQSIMQTLKKPAVERTKEEKQKVQHFALCKGILYREYIEGKQKRKLFVIPRTMRKFIAIKHHEFAGHFAADKVIELLRRRFWFPNMTSYVKQHVRQCLNCTFNKQPAGRVQGQLNPISPGKRPFEIVHLDFLGPFVTSSKRNNDLLVLVDNLTKFVRLRSYPSTATKYVLKFLEDFINDYGLPRRMITDRGTCFTSKEFQAFCTDKGIKHTLTCTQRPQANGQVERINRVLIPAIANSMQNPTQRDWDARLSTIQRDINAAASKTTGKSPFELLHGYVPEFTGQFPRELLPDEDSWIDPHTLQEKARESIQEVQKQAKKRYDLRRSQAVKYNIGDVVVVRRLPEATGEPTKTQAKYRGPMVITKTLSSDVYQISNLRPESQGRRRRQNYVTTAHANQLKLFKLADEDQDAIDDDQDVNDDAKAPMKDDRANSTIHSTLTTKPSEKQSEESPKADDSPKLTRSRRKPAYLKDYV